MASKTIGCDDSRLDTRTLGVKRERYLRIRTQLLGYDELRLEGEH